MGWWARRRGRALTPALRSVALAIALLLLLAAARIPLGGCVAVMVLLMLGLGAFWIEVYRRYVQPRDVPVPAPIPSE